MDWLDLLAVQGTLKSLLQHHSSKASILRCSAFFTLLPLAKVLEFRRGYASLYFLDFETGACSLHFYIPSLGQLGTRTSEAKASLHSPISFILETLFPVPSTGVPAWMQASGFFPLRRNSSLPRARLTLLLLMGINLSIATPHSYPFIQQDVF